MSAPEASTPARDAIDAFLRHLTDRDLSATTRRIRRTYLNEYLRHAQQAEAAGTEDDAPNEDQAQEGAAGYDEPGLASLAVVLAALSSGGSVAFARFLERWL